jgi:hypothetical protein
MIKGTGSGKGSGQDEGIQFSVDGILLVGNRFDEY